MPDKKPNRMPDRLSDIVLDKMSNGMPSKMPVNMSDQMSDRIPDGISKNRTGFMWNRMPDRWWEHMFATNSCRFSFVHPQNLERTYDPPITSKYFSGMWAEPCLRTSLSCCMSNIYFPIIKPQAQLLQSRSAGAGAYDRVRVEAFSTASGAWDECSGPGLQSRCAPLHPGLAICLAMNWQSRREVEEATRRQEEEREGGSEGVRHTFVKI